MEADGLGKRRARASHVDNGAYTMATRHLRQQLEVQRTRDTKSAIASTLARLARAVQLAGHAHVAGRLIDEAVSLIEHQGPDRSTATCRFCGKSSESELLRDFGQLRSWHLIRSLLWKMPTQARSSHLRRTSSVLRSHRAGGRPSTSHSRWRRAGPKRDLVGANLVIRRKSLAMEATLAVRRAEAASESPRLSRLLRLRRVLRERLTTCELGLDNRISAKQHDRLVERLHETERAIARLVPEVGVPSMLRTVDVGRLSQALPRGSALVEFVRYSYNEIAPTPRRPPVETVPTYGAFVVVAEDLEAVQFFELGLAVEIDDLIQNADFAVDRSTRVWRRAAVHGSARPNIDSHPEHHRDTSANISCPRESTCTDTV